MSKKLNNIEAPLIPAGEVSYLLNGIKEGNNEMKMGKINIKTDHIVMEVVFEATVAHVSNCLPEVIATRGISSVETDLEVKVKNQEREINTLSRKDSGPVGEHPIA